MQKIIAAILAFIMQIASFFGFSFGGGKTPELPPEINEDDQIINAIVELDVAGLLEGIVGAKQREELVENIDSNESYKEIGKVQEKVKELIKNKFSSANFENSYSYSFVMNGFSLEIPYSCLDELCKIPGIKAVGVAPQYELPEDMSETDDFGVIIPGLTNRETPNESDYFTGVLDVRKQGYNGKGTVIAIVDSGFQLDHEVFSNPVEDPTLSKSDINKKSAFGFLDTIVPRFGAHYYSEKIPYKWDYAKVDKDVYNANSDHGTHVAGIAAGKSDVMTGVAPEAQLLLMKVFGDEEDSLAKGEVILAALDDSVKLGADVVNLSLGTRAGQEPEDIFTADVIKRLRKAGVAVCGAAGNEASLSRFDRVWGDNMNIELFDYGTANSPATYGPLLSVASTAVGYRASDPDEDIISLPEIGSVQMSYYSGWGPTADLRLKPEISCPGSDIYSSVNGNDYDYMSGTSMASPFYSGCVALMKQYVRERFPEMKEKDMTEFIHSILMSTAKPFKETNRENCYSPRQQGAGFIDLKSAFSTPAYLTQADGVSRPKIELFENSNGVLELSFVLHNFSDKELTYDLSELVMTDEYATVRGENVNTLETKKLSPSQQYTVEFLNAVDKNGKVTVAANSDSTVKMKITVNEEFLKQYSEVFINGFYLDGFVYLKDENGENATLSIPFLAFYGDWGKDMLFDRTIYDEEQSYLDADWGLMVTDGNDYYTLGANLFEDDEYNVDTKYCAYSKNALGMKKPYVSVGIGLLRNSKRMDYNLFTKSGIFRYCGSSMSDNCRKTISVSTAMHGVLWGGKSGLIDGNEYVYKVSTKPYNYEGKKQTLSFPFVVDNERPSIESCNYEIRDGRPMLDIKIKDNRYVMGFQVLDNDDRKIGEVSFKGMEPDENGVYTYSCDLKSMSRYRDFNKISTLKLYVVDYAYNEVFGCVERTGSACDTNGGFVITPDVKFEPTEILKARAYNFPESSFVMEEASSIIA